MVEPVYNAEDTSHEELVYTDHNGVKRQRNTLYEQQYTDEQLRSMKQKFLMENVLNCGYDPAEFA